MTRIVLDPATSARLKQEAADQIELCDDSGHTLGFFKPLADRSLYEGLEIPFTEEELALAEQETKTYSTAEVLAHLKSRSGVDVFRALDLVGP